MLEPFYKEKNIEIYHGDCFEILSQLEPVDLVLTDPPYNIGDENKRTKQGNEIKSNKEAWGKWDNYDKKEYDLMIINTLERLFKLLKEGGSLYMFTAREDNGFFIRKAVEIGFVYRNQIAIIKTNPLPHFNKNNWRSAFELCMYLSKGKPKTFNFLSQQECINTMPYPIGKKDSKHPTEKPIKCIKRIVAISSNENDLILDPFMGSGTTLVASKRLRRKAIGIEIEKEYCEIAKLRIKNTAVNLF